MRNYKKNCFMTQGNQGRLISSTLFSILILLVLFSFMFSGSSLAQEEDALFSERPDYILGGHQDSVRAVAWAPNRDLLASGGAGDNIILWQAEEGEIKYILTGHTDSINALEFSPQDNYLASASADNTVRIWNLDDLQEEMVFQDHSDWVTDLAWSSEEDYLFSSSWDRTVRKWDLSTGEQAEKFSDYSGWVRALSFFPEENLLATGAGDKLKVLDTETGETVIEKNAFQGRITALRWSPDGTKLAVGDDAGEVEVINRADWRSIEAFTPPARTIQSLAWSPNGEELAASGDHREISLYSLTENEQKKLSGHGDDIPDIQWSPGGNRIISGSRDRKIKVWSKEDQKPLYVREGHTDTINALDWSPADNYLASADDDKYIRLWSPPKPTSQGRLSGHIGPIEDISWSPSGERLASASQDEAVIVWDPMEKEQLYVAGDHGRIFRTDIFLPRGREKKTHDDWVFSVNWSLEEQYLASTSYDGTIGIWQAEDGSEVNILSPETGWVRTALWTPEGEELISGGKAGGIHVWSTAGDLKHRFGEEAGEIGTMTWLTNDEKKLLATSHDDNSLRLWDFASQEQLDRLSTEGYIFAKSWSPKRNYLAAAVESKKIKIWQLEEETLTEVASLPLPGFSGLSPRAITWSPEEDLLAVSDGPYLLFWDLTENN